jgi:hypothetical protein
VGTLFQVDELFLPRHVDVCNAFVGEGLGDEVMAAALIDRVLHHCHLVNIRGNSYRMREHTELYRTLQPDANPPEPVIRTRKSKAAGH